MFFAWICPNILYPMATKSILVKYPTKSKWEHTWEYSFRRLYIFFCFRNMYFIPLCSLSLKIHNPFRFWFHVHKEQHVLDILMHQIERYYTTMDANELRIPVVCLNPGQICAASFNGMWHRGEIVAPPVNNKVKVIRNIKR